MGHRHSRPQPQPMPARNEPPWQLFDAYDRNHDGSLSRDEFEAMRMAAMGSGHMMAGSMASIPYGVSMTYGAPASGGSLPCSMQGSFAGSLQQGSFHQTGFVQGGVPQTSFQQSGLLRSGSLQCGSQLSGSQQGFQHSDVHQGGYQESGFQSAQDMSPMIGGPDSMQFAAGMLGEYGYAPSSTQIGSSVGSYQAQPMGPPAIATTSMQAAPALSTATYIPKSASADRLAPVEYGAPVMPNRPAQQADFADSMQIQLASDLFSKLDRDGDGVITRQELLNLQAALSNGNFSASACASTAPAVAPQFAAYATPPTTTTQMMMPMQAEPIAATAALPTMTYAAPARLMSSPSPIPSYVPAVAATYATPQRSSSAPVIAQYTAPPAHAIPAVAGSYTPPPFPQAMGLSPASSFVPPPKPTFMPAPPPPGYANVAPTYQAPAVAACATSTTATSAAPMALVPPAAQVQYAQYALPSPVQNFARPSYAQACYQAPVTYVAPVVQTAPAAYQQVPAEPVAMLQRVASTGYSDSATYNGGAAFRLGTAGYGTYPAGHACGTSGLPAAYAGGFAQQSRPAAFNLSDSMDLFDKIDRDKSGYISREEFAAALVAYQRQMSGLPAYGDDCSVM